MGYYVKKVKHVRTPGAWKLQFVSFKREHTASSKAKKPKKEWDIPKDDWPSLGFYKGMSYELAKIRCKQLNSKLKLKRKEEIRRLHQQTRLRFENEHLASFPKDLKEQFELRYVWGRRVEVCKNHKLPSHWKAAQLLILKVQLDPREWHDHAHAFYDYFFAQQYSISYVRKILRMANLWGFFISRKLGLPFLPVPNPRGYEKSRLIDAYYLKTSSKSRRAAPLTPKKLEDSSRSLTKSQYNWLYLSVWLGLRPKEIDSLKDGKSSIKTSPDGTKVLWVYQSKLTSLPPWQRWKLIPLVCKEQLKSLAILRSNNFLRPSLRAIKRILGTIYGLYSGRKGFTDLMLSKNYPLEFISQWMGHHSLDRTWKDYKDKTFVHYYSRSHLA